MLHTHKENSTQAVVLQSHHILTDIPDKLMDAQCIPLIVKEVDLNILQGHNNNLVNHTLPHNNRALVVVVQEQMRGMVWLLHHLRQVYLHRLEEEVIHQEARILNLLMLIKEDHLVPLLFLHKLLHSHLQMVTRVKTIIIPKHRLNRYF
jgi:hypothetical protein